MDAWLSEMEMAWNEDPIQSNNLHDNEEYNQQNEDMDTLNEELAAFLGDDFCFNIFDEEISSISSLLNCTPKKPINLLSQSILSGQQLPPLSDTILPTDNQNIDNDCSPNSIEPIIRSDQQVPDHLPNNTTSDKKYDLNDEDSVKISGKKRRRDPVKVHDHIMAERKRRELLTQRFIALSAIVPGLKKVDKISVLEEAIKYLQEMQEKVKELEKATSKQVGGSMMVAKKAQLILDKENESSIIVDNVNWSTCSSGGSDGHQSDIVPEIEVKVTRNTILLRICCMRRKGILAKIYQVVEIRGMIVLNTNVVAFETSALDITILAQMEGAAKYDTKVKELLRTLHSSLHAPRPC